jgi:type I restriction enzyme R subunit
MKPDEAAFESHIAEWLAEHGGYTGWKVGTQSSDFAAGRGLDTGELFAFIEDTQPDEWAKVLKTHAGSSDAARAGFLDRLIKELDARGTVDVLRHGLVYAGHEKAEFALAWFRPASGLNPLLATRYDANRLTVTRQLAYDPGSNKTVDLGLFVNGIPVATAEVKNHLTGQTVDNAKAQYRTDRDPKNLTLRRALVHFALDTEQVFMTTHLDGERTVFLPFNRGDGLAAGNPANPDGHRSAYLWESVWQKDAWLDILQRFIHVEAVPKGSKKPATMIFPRFHQWDAVLRLEADARAGGAGHSYLVQHSAGSGKSNTIAWLAHRLSSLHAAGDVKVFDKVVVITDRVVLDRQLQDTIYQFEHAHGVVQKIDLDSTQLAEALAGEQARIIITTLQKFPFVLDKVGTLPSRRYAVIIDEAHSSQTGEAAKDLKKVLGAAGSDPEVELAQAEAAEASLVVEVGDPAEEALLAEVTARGRQPNLSFFAFTATPKGRTLEMFGGLNPDTGKHEPSHLYSMRQAIEEGFIWDVLANFTTYKTYWRIEKAVEDDPKYETDKAKAAIARFVAFHEHNLAQKAEVIIEHYRRHVRPRMRGKAKAMVVTSSRLHAVRYSQALKKYCNENGHGDIGVLVAFSDSLTVDGEKVTESNLNGFPETQTTRRFDEDDNHILVVAEKYQTGFDQPKLYAMYVDKVLTGLAAVQTLSRLNRTHPDKTGTFVLDFRNEAEDIRTSFAPWYVQTVAPPTDPHLLYDTHGELGGYGILHPEEVHTVVTLLLTDASANHARIHGALAPAIDRFHHDLDTDEQDAFRDALHRFIRIYSFLSQVVSFGDTKLERDYLFARALAPFIRADAEPGVDLGSQVELTHLALEKTSEGAASLDPDVEGEVVTIFSGAGKIYAPDEAPLSEIIAQMNERFGTRFTDAQAVHTRTIVDALVADEDVQGVAWANDEKAFGEVYGDFFQNAMIDMAKAHEDFTYKLLDDPELFGKLIGATLPGAYAAAKVASQQWIPIGDLLAAGETASIEYKSTLRTHTDGGEVFKPLETASLKTIAAFLNSASGGTLLIGVADDGTVVGLDSDYSSLTKEGKDYADLFQLHLTQIVQASMGDAAAANVSTQIHTIDGKDLCRVHVKPSAYPVDAEVTVVKDGQHWKKTAFYVRLNNKTHEFTDADEKQKYIAQRWGS